MLMFFGHYTEVIFFSPIVVEQMATFEMLALISVHDQTGTYSNNNPHAHHNPGSLPCKTSRLFDDHRIIFHNMAPLLALKIIFFQPKVSVPS